MSPSSNEDWMEAFLFLAPKTLWEKGKKYMLALKIMAGIFLIAGFGTVLEAKLIVKKMKLDQKVSVNFENEMDDEEEAQYKRDKAMINVKMTGMLIALPGLILTLIAFK